MNPLLSTAEEQTRREEAADHARAQARGAHVADLARAGASALFGEGQLSPATSECDARVTLFRALADRMYGLQAVDIPDLRA